MSTDCVRARAGICWSHTRADHCCCRQSLFAGLCASRRHGSGRMSLVSQTRHCVCAPVTGASPQSVQQLLLQLLRARHRRRKVANLRMTVRLSPVCCRQPVTSLLMMNTCAADCDKRCAFTGPYKDTVNLPQTSFNMRANSIQREPQIQKFWQDNKVYERCLADDTKVR